MPRWLERRRLDELKFKMRKVLERQELGVEGRASASIAAAWLGRNFRRNFAPVTLATNLNPA